MVCKRCIFFLESYERGLSLILISPKCTFIRIRIKYNYVDILYNVINHDIHNKTWKKTLFQLFNFHAAHRRTRTQQVPTKTAATRNQRADGGLRIRCGKQLRQPPPSSSSAPTTRLIVVVVVVGGGQQWVDNDNGGYSDATEMCWRRRGGGGRIVGNPGRRRWRWQSQWVSTRRRNRRVRGMPRQCSRQVECAERRHIATLSSKMHSHDILLSCRTLQKKSHRIQIIKLWRKKTSCPWFHLKSTPTAKYL